MKQFTPKQNKIFIIVGVIICVLAVGFLCRGWIRGTVLPKLFEARYDHQVQSAFDQASQELKPTRTLGLKTVRTNAAGCNLDTASGLTANINCGASQMTSRPLTNADELASLKEQTLAFDKRIRSAGWTGGQESKLTTPTESSLEQGVYWLSYGKKFDGIECLFQLGSFYRSDGTGTAEGSLICSRESTY